MTLPKNTNGAAILAAINGKTMALRKTREDELVVSTPPEIGLLNSKT